MTDRAAFLRLALLFVAAAAPSPALASDTLNACADHSIPPEVPFVLPADDAIHFDGGTYTKPYEQFYWNGTFRTPGANGKLYGFEAIVIQLNVNPTDDRFTLLYAQTSLADASTQTMHVDAMVQFVPLEPRAGLISLAIENPEIGARFEVSAGGGRDDLHIEFSSGPELRVHMEGVKNPSFQFFDGVGNYTDPVTGHFHGEQLYYSRPRMAIGGFLRIDGQMRPVFGEGWFDRMFGTTLSDVSWTWFSIRLDDGEDIHMWDMPSLLTGNSLIRVVNVLGAPPACEARTITEFDFQRLGAFESPRAPGDVWPTSYTFDIPELGLELEIEPVFLDQVLVNPLGFFAPFWEGMAFVSGTRNGEPVTGMAYVELTNSCCT